MEMVLLGNTGANILCNFASGGIDQIPVAIQLAWIPDSFEDMGAGDPGNWVSPNTINRQAESVQKKNKLPSCFEVTGGKMGKLSTTKLL